MSGTGEPSELSIGRIVKLFRSVDSRAIYASNQLNFNTYFGS